MKRPKTRLGVIGNPYANDFQGFAHQYAHDSKLRALGGTAQAAFDEWHRRRVGGSSARRKPAPSRTSKPATTLYRKGETIRVHTHRYRARRDVALPPWRAPLSWERLR